MVAKFTVVKCRWVLSPRPSGVVVVGFPRRASRVRSWCSIITEGWRVIALPLLLVFVDGVNASAATKAPGREASGADALPRKVIVGSALAHFSGTLDQRIALAARLLQEAVAAADREYAGRPLDLMVFPEFAFDRAVATAAAERAIALDDPALRALGDQARHHGAWIVAPLTLHEPGAQPHFSNAAVLFDRGGVVAGVFRKVHPVADRTGVFEGGVTAGNNYPVFDCDFGRLGILICWDMAYAEAWSALAERGAQIVAVPSASPQTIRPMSEAQRHGYYVVTSTPRDNASLFDPIGLTAAQITHSGVLVHEIDLSFAILHWSEGLREGQAMADRFGPRVGYRYSSREDTGLFWSNDPERSIGSMVRELGLEQMSDMVRRIEAVRQGRRPAEPAPPTP